MKNGPCAAVCWRAHVRARSPVAARRAAPHSAQHRRIGPILSGASARRLDTMRRQPTLPLPYRPRCPACDALAQAGSPACARCGRALTPLAAANEAGTRDTAARRRLGEMAPRHLASADSNGARRWGLSFGAGVVLFAVVGAFGAYMATEAYDDENAWNRPNVQRTREPQALRATSSCDTDDGRGGCLRSHAAERAPVVRRGAPPSGGAGDGDGDGTSIGTGTGTSPSIGTNTNTGTGANVKRTAPTAYLAQSAKAPVSSANHDAPAAIKHRPLSSGAQAASAKQGSHRVARQGFASNGPRRPPRPELAGKTRVTERTRQTVRTETGSRPPPSALPLPRLSSARPPSSVVPSSPAPSPPSFDLSDNQRALYRGH